MAKAIVCPYQTVANGQNVLILYSMSVIGGQSVFSLGLQYQVDTTISVSSNLTAWKNQVIARAAEQGVTLALSDVIIFGAPS